MLHHSIISKYPRNRTTLSLSLQIKVYIKNNCGGWGQRRMMEGINSTMIYCKKFCKCHNVPSEQQ
jgi:hypothetical protein